MFNLGLKDGVVGFGSKSGQVLLSADLEQRCWASGWIKLPGSYQAICSQRRQFVSRASIFLVHIVVKMLGLVVKPHQGTSMISGFTRGFVHG